MKKIILLALTLSLYSCKNDSAKIEIVKTELKKIYIDKNMVDNLDFTTDVIKDKDAYTILHNDYQKDYIDGLTNDVDIQESKAKADNFLKLEYSAEGDIEFTKVNYKRIVDGKTLMEGSYFINGNSVIGKVYK